MDLFAKFLNDGDFHLIESRYFTSFTDEFPRVALKALQQNKITKEQYASVCMIWSASKDFNFKTEKPICYNLFNKDGTIDASTEVYFKKILFQNQESLDKFYELMRQEPRSEHFACLGNFKDPSPHNSLYNGLSDINFTIFMPAFFVDAQGNKTQRIFIPSFSMMKNYLIARFKDDAVLPWTVLGFSTPFDIEMDIFFKRHQFGLNSSGVDPIINADGYDTGYYGWTLHDFFHCYIASRLPYPHRLIFGEMTALLKKRMAEDKANLSEEDILILRGTIEEFIDMQHGSNYPLNYNNMTAKEKTKILSQNFFKAIQELVSGLINVGKPKSYHATLIEALQQPEWIKKIACKV